jgi:hypothetical protein
MEEPAMTTLTVDIKKTRSMEKKEMIFSMVVWAEIRSTEEKVKMRFTVELKMINFMEKMELI